jgi:hypothetical protein
VAISIMNNHQSKTIFVVLAAAIAAVFMASIVSVIAAEAQRESLAEEKGTNTGRTLAEEKGPKNKIVEEKIKGPKKRIAEERRGGRVIEEALIKEAPIATSGNNVYIAWWSNKTGNDEVMFRASTDNGVTFGNKINLSNTTEADSQDAQISASGNKVYVTWWERNQTSEEPVLRTSNNNGGTFGPLLRLASNGTIGGAGG